MESERARRELAVRLRAEILGGDAGDPVLSVERTTYAADGVIIDNQVHIAHNCEIGDRTAISAQTGISGSTKVGRDVIMAGQVGLADHMSVGDGVVFAARAGAHGRIPDGKILAGAPAMDHRQWIRMSGHLPRLDRYAREIADLKKRVEELEAESE